MKIGFFYLLFIIPILTLASEMTPVISYGYGENGNNVQDVVGGKPTWVRFGSGFFLMGGVNLVYSPTRPHQFETQLTAGYKGILGIGPDESVSWTRFPIELMSYYRNNVKSYRLGWGVSYELGNHLSGTGGDNADQQLFDNALGWIASAEYIAIVENDTKHLSVGIKYISIKYHSSTLNREADGSSYYFCFSLFTDHSTSF